MEIYFRNPDRYAEHIRDFDIDKVVFDYGHAVIRRINPIKWAKLFMQEVDWRVMTVAIEGAQLYSPKSKNLDSPDAVYPTWCREHGFDLLESYCKKPVGKDMKLCFDESIPKEFRPVWGQAHKILIYNVPTIKEYEGKEYLRYLREIMAKYPDVEFIIHNVQSYRVMFSGFSAAFFDPNYVAQKGSVITPGGKLVNSPDFAEYKNWIHMFGYSVKDLRVSAYNRVCYNIESVRWAEKNFNKNVNFGLRAVAGIDYGTKSGKHDYEEVYESWLTGSNRRFTLKMEPDDGVVCGNCSLSAKCKFYREGAVCSVPGTSSSDLSSMFGTRDADSIIDGLVKLTNIQAVRVQRDLEEEEASGERSPMTDRRIKDLMDSGTKVAKLVDPKLNGASNLINIGIVGGATIVAEQTPQQLMANTVKALEAQGIDRADITPEMIRGVIEGMGNRAAVKEVAAIEAGTVVDAEVVE